MVLVLISKLVELNSRELLTESQNEIEDPEETELTGTQMNTGRCFKENSQNENR